MNIYNEFVNYYPSFYFEKAKSTGTDMPKMHYHDKYEIYYLKSGVKKHRFLKFYRDLLFANNFASYNVSVL